MKKMRKHRNRINKLAVYSSYCEPSLTKCNSLQLNKYLLPILNFYSPTLLQQVFITIITEISKLQRSV